MRFLMNIKKIIIISSILALTGFNCLGMDISKLDKAKLLQALYEQAQPQGQGYLQYSSSPLSYEEAKSILERQRGHIDYLHGRVMKVDLSGDTFSTRLYNRDNGQGAAESIVQRLQSEQNQ